MNDFYDDCYLKHDISLLCSKGVQIEMDIDHAETLKCVVDSIITANVAGKGTLSDLIKKDNSILKEEKIQMGKNNIQLYPMATIDGA